LQQNTEIVLRSDDFLKYEKIEMVSCDDDLFIIKNFITILIKVN